MPSVGVKPQLTLEKKCRCHYVVFGSARFLPPEQAQHDVGVAEQALENDPDNDTDGKPEAGEKGN